MKLSLTCFTFFLPFLLLLLSGIAMLFNPARPTDSTHQLHTQLFFFSLYLHQAKTTERESVKCWRGETNREREIRGRGKIGKWLPCPPTLFSRILYVVFLLSLFLYVHVSVYVYVSFSYYRLLVICSVF